MSERISGLREKIMLDETAIEQRLAALEQEVAMLKQKTADSGLDNLIGSISDEDAFQKALEYGRAYRDADKPDDESETA